MTGLAETIPLETDSGGQSAGTVMIALFRPLSVRMILKSAILPTLKSGGARIVLLTPFPDVPSIRAQFGYDVAFETLDRLALVGGDRKGMLRRFMRGVRHLTYNANATGGMGTREVQRTLSWLDNVTPATRFGGRLYVRAMLDIPLLLGRSRLLREGWIALERALFARESTHGEIFARHRPDLVIVSSAGYAGDEQIMIEAKRFGARTVSVIESWDNPSTKGYRGGMPDHAVVWSEAMRRDYVEFQDIPADRIHVGGVSHWDGYFGTPPSADERRAFFAMFGMNPDRKLIYMPTPSLKMYRHNLEVARLVADAIADGRIPGRPQLLIRPHPVYLEQSQPRWVAATNHDLNGFRELREMYSEDVFVDLPRHKRYGRLIDLAPEDQDLMRLRLASADVMVGNYTTQAIEAALFDLPIVNVAFGPFKSTDMPNSVVDGFAHYSRIIATGAIWNAGDEASLIDHIVAYLADPALHRAERKLLADQEVPVNRGTAGQRIGEYLVNLLATVRAGRSAA